MSNKTYVTILESEFDAIFKADRNWVKTTTDSSEIVYTKCPKARPNIQIKVYSSVHKNSSLSRPVGQDAIRVCAINLNTNKGVRKSKRVNRVAGWETRVQERVTEIWNDLLAEIK